MNHQKLIKLLNKNQPNIPNFEVWNREIEKYFGKKDDYICPICPDHHRIDGVGMNQEELIIHLTHQHGKYGERLINYCWNQLLRKSTQPTQNWKTGEAKVRIDRQFVLNNKTIQDIIKHARIEMGIIKKCINPLCCCEFQKK